MREIRRVTKKLRRTAVTAHAPGRIVKRTYAENLSPRARNNFESDTKTLRVRVNLNKYASPLCSLSGTDMCAMRSLCRLTVAAPRVLIDAIWSIAMRYTTLHRQVMFPIVGRDLSQREEMREKGCKKALVLHAIYDFFKKIVVYNLLTRKKRWCINSIKSSWK